MAKPTPARALECLTLALPWALALLVTAGWLHWALTQVDAHEASIASKGGTAYAVFVQISHNWTTGWGWVQTAHPTYVDQWYWGGHFGVLWLAAAKLSALSDSPWFLARFQVTLIGLGCFTSWLLGRAEGGSAGGLAGLVLYAGSGAVAFIAMEDYQDLALCLPFIPLAVLAARHGRCWTFVLAAAALAATREELWLLLPLVGLSKNLGRAMLGAGVALAWYWLLTRTTPIAWEPPVLFRVDEMHGSLQPILDPRRLSLETHVFAWGNALPWFLLQPVCAAVVICLTLFHAQPELSGLTSGMALSHHYAPVAGFALTGGVIVLGRLAGTKGWAAVLAVLLACSSTAWALQRSLPELERQIHRGDGATHPAWVLLEQVPGAAVLYVPAPLSPAAAKRRWLASDQSGTQRISEDRITHAIVPEGCGIQGRVLARSAPWVLLENPSGLPFDGAPLPWELHGSRFMGCTTR